MGISVAHPLFSGQIETNFMDLTVAIFFKKPSKSHDFLCKAKEVPDWCKKMLVSQSLEFTIHTPVYNVANQRYLSPQHKDKDQY